MKAERTLQPREERKERKTPWPPTPRTLRLRCGATSSRRMRTGMTMVRVCEFLGRRGRVWRAAECAKWAMHRRFFFSTDARSLLPRRAPVLWRQRISRSRAETHGRGARATALHAGASVAPSGRCLGGHRVLADDRRGRGPRDPLLSPPPAWPTTADALTPPTPALTTAQSSTRPFTALKRAWSCRRPASSTSNTLTRAVANR